MSTENGPGYDLGSILWHCSEEDGGPDVGIQVGLGGGLSLYFGEMANVTLEDHGVDLERFPDGWWVVLFGGPSGTRILGAVPDGYEAREACDEIAAALPRRRAQAMIELTRAAEEAACAAYRAVDMGQRWTLEPAMREALKAALPYLKITPAGLAALSQNKDADHG